MLKRRYIVAIFLFTLFTIQNSVADSNFKDRDYEPEKFHTTNNLLRLPGGSEYVCGEQFIFKGRVIDSAGMPVMNAKIYLWHAACDGKYPYKPMRTGLDKKKINLHNASSFRGSGISYSDNLGHFTFISVHSPSKNHISKRLNFRIIHPGLKDRELNIDLSKIRYQPAGDGTKIYRANIGLEGRLAKRY